MSLKEFIRWLTVILLCSVYQSPVTARPNIAPSDAGTIFNDALNSESRIDEVPPPDTLQATPPPNSEDTYPIDDGNATQIVTEVLPLSTGTQDEVSLNQLRDEDNTTEDTKTSINFDGSTTVDNSTDVVKDSQLGVLVTDVTTQEIPSANIFDFDLSTLNIPTATVPNFEESKIFEEIPINIRKEIIKLEEEIIKDNLGMNPLLYSTPASSSNSLIPTTTSESTSINFEESKIMEDVHKEYDDTIRLEDNLLKQLEIVEAVRNNIEEETTVKYVESTESSLKFTMEEDELTSIESIFGNLGAMPSINDGVDELENVSDIFTESSFSVENNNDEYTDIPNGSIDESNLDQFEDDSQKTSSMTPIVTMEEFTTQSIGEKGSIIEHNLENMRPSMEEMDNATSVIENTIEEKSSYTTENSNGPFIENIDITMERIDEVTTEEIETLTASTNDADNNFNGGLPSTEDSIANATEEIANSTEASTYTTDKTLQSLKTEGSDLDSITEDHYFNSERIYNSNIREFSLFASDAPTVSPSDFDDLDAISTEFEYEEVDSDMTNIEYVSETGSGDYQVDVTIATENSEIISEEIIGNGRFDTINIIDLISHKTTETPTTATAAPTTTTTTTEDSKYSTERFIVNYDQNETSEEIKTNFDISTGIEENIVHVDNEVGKPSLTEPHFTVRDDNLYNPKSVIEVEDNILSLLPILEDELLSKEESVTEQHQTSVELSVPVSSANETTIKQENITEVPIINSKTIDALNTSSHEGKNLPVATRSKLDEEYDKLEIISTSDHSTVVEYRHSDSAEICFEGSFGYQLTADVMDKDGNENRLDTPKYKDTFKKKCVNSKFPVLRITQNYSSIELRFLLEPGYLFVDEISAMISLEGHDYQAVSSDIDLFISLLDDSGTLRTNLHREFIRERSKPEGTSMIVTLFDVQLTAHTSNNYERVTEGTSMDELKDEELNGDEAQDEAIHTAVLVVTILLSAATLIIVLVLLVKIFLKYKSKKMVYILSVR